MHFSNGSGPEACAAGQFILNTASIVCRFARKYFLKATKRSHAEYMANLQEILNKVEYFPVKCRIQNAKENFRKYREILRKNQNFWQNIESNASSPKMKVCCKSGMNLVHVGGSA